MLKKILYLLLPCFMLALSPAATGSGTVIKGARVWRSPEKTRVVFDLSHTVKHKAFMLHNPERLVLDIAQTRLPGSLAKLTWGETPVAGLRWADQPGDTLRIVFDLKSTFSFNSFVLRPYARYGHRLVVDLFDERVLAQLNRRRPEVPSSSRVRPIVVAIDAGHGGEDPGAIGHRGAKEKNVVLAIASEIEKLFESEIGFQPLMVRSGDYYVSLRGRTSKARENNADVFISIHADAHSRTSAHGASVYTLSQRGATSETARWLEGRENSTDLVGGEDGVSIGDKDDLLATVLLDLSMTDSQARSERIGGQVLGHLKRIGKLHKKKVEQAAFVVLKSPDIPSILVETGFITNPAEAGRLVNRSHQRRVARAIFTGVRDFFHNNPPPGTLVESKRSGKRRGSRSPVRTYQVRRGDTLSGIAQRYRVSLKKLLQANRLRASAVLRIGQTVRLP